MSDPTYRIAQALHARRAAVGLPKYGQQLTADSPGCMLVHALEESADKTNYLIAEVQRRREAITALCALRAIHGGIVPDTDTVATIQRVIDLLGGEAALARYDEILGTVAENAKVDERKIIAEAIADLSAEQPELREYRFSRYVGGKLKAEGAVVMATSDRHAAEKLTKLCCDHPAILIGGQVPTTPDSRDEALRVATEALCDARDQIEALCSADDVPDSVHTALAAIRGAR